MQRSDFENLIRYSCRIEAAALHIQAQVIGHLLQSIESRRWRSWCGRYDTSGERERFLRIPYRR